MTTIRNGPIWLPEDFEDDLEFNAEISEGGIWKSVNDFVHYRVAAEGFGSTSQTFRRIELNSSFYAGTYDVNHVPDSQKRTLAIWVKGRSMDDLAQARDDAIEWFTQNDFLIRITRGDTYEYWECDCADYNLDESHVFMHSRMCKLTFTMSVMPYIGTYVVL